VAVFVFKGDDAASERVRAQVVRALRARGLKVVTTLRPVDSAEQFREMAVTLNLAVYVDGEVNEDGDQASAAIHLRSGVTGLRVASATFSGDRKNLAFDVRKALWGRVGDSFVRICADAAKPRKHDRAPMRIEAGTPIENTPADPPRGT
jgi:hypothetical protein